MIDLFRPAKRVHRKSRLTDELEIRALCDRFSDAANRIDAEAFRALWVADGVWTIGPPIKRGFEGRDAIVDAFANLLENAWDLFVQLPSAHVFKIDGNTATGRCYIYEIARSVSGQGNLNVAVYEDKLIKTSGHWRFVSRDYKVLYLDQSPLDGEAFQRRLHPGENAISQT